MFERAGYERIRLQTDSVGTVEFLGGERKGKLRRPFSLGFLFGLRASVR